MSDWNKEFGESREGWISAKQFDGEGCELTYKSFKKVEPEDLEFIIGGTQNDIIKDSKGKPVLTKEGKEIKNAYHDPLFPNGYQMHIFFEEGTLSCTSFPLLKEMHRISPKSGERLKIRRDASVLTQTKYFISRVNTFGA